jgi:hypothetical protein
MLHGLARTSRSTAEAPSLIPDAGLALLHGACCVQGHVGAYAFQSIMSSLSAADLFGVKGRVALVTGGCSGLGLMIAKASKLHPAQMVVPRLT